MQVYLYATGTYAQRAEVKCASATATWLARARALAHDHDPASGHPIPLLSLFLSYIPLNPFSHNYRVASALRFNHYAPRPHVFALLKAHADLKVLSVITIY